MGGGRFMSCKSISVYSLISLCLFLVCVGPANSCTIAVVSGSVTTDGRPLLWKNRDIGSASRADQEVRFFNDGEMGGYLALVSTDYHDTTTAYVGVNDAGFSIMNSVSPDLAGGSPSSHGILMKLALQVCETVDDFEALLVSTAGNRGYTWSNFGVIDRLGNASIFEATDADYRRYDAQDHGGYIVRANNSIWGGGDLGLRYERASLLIDEAIVSGTLDHTHMIRKVARDLGGPPTLPCGQWPTVDPALSRNTTRSSVVVHGVLSSENPKLTTFWCTLGEPSCGISVPMWSSAGHPSALLQDPPQQAAMCGAIQANKLTCYDNLANDVTLDTEVLVGLDGLGGIQGFSFPVEDEAFDNTEARLMIWRDISPTAEQMAHYQTDCSARAYHYYTQESEPQWLDLQPARDLTASAGHEQISLTWSDPLEAFTAVEIWRTCWADTSGTSIYPLYQNHEAGVDPQRPSRRTNVQTEFAWERIAVVDPGVETFVDTIAARGQYGYEMFVLDGGYNTSLPTAESAWATNYFLGDVTGTVGAPIDGIVSVTDITQLAVTYGLVAETGGFDSFCDVAPTHDWSPTGRPQPDGIVNFEDLMIFSLNFGVVGSSKRSLPDATSASLVWQRRSDGQWALALEAPCAALQGLHLSAAQPIAFEDLTQSQEHLSCFQNTAAGGLDVAIVALGSNSGFFQVGELLCFPATFRPQSVTIQARDKQNQSMIVDADIRPTTLQLPNRVSLKSNYPNPFNPQTTIAYTLPAAGPVCVQICSLAGRLISVLVDERQSAGAHEIVWNGCDGQGRPVASGVYLYRLQTADESLSRRMCLVR